MDRNTRSGLLLVELCLLILSACNLLPGSGKDEDDGLDLSISFTDISSYGEYEATAQFWTNEEFWKVS